MVRFPALAIALLLAHPAFAAEPLEPLNFQGGYGFYWGGIPFGEMRLTTTEKGSDFSAESEMRVTGLASLFTSLKSTAKVSGRRNSPWNVSTRTYETSYTSKNKPRYVKLVYGKGGTITEEIVEPPENRDRRPAVPEALKKASLDPLSYIFAVRQELHDALREGRDRFTVRLYDGRRLMDTTYVIGRRESGFIEATGSRSAVDGFTAKELKKMASEPTVQMRFSDDERLIPLKLEMPLGPGVATAVLESSP